MIGFWGGVFLGMSVTRCSGLVGLERAWAALTQPPAIEVVVLGKDSGKPLPGATVRFSIDFGTAIARADKNGLVRLDLSKRTFQDALALDVWAEGYVQQRYCFAQNDIRFPKIPAAAHSRAIARRRDTGWQGRRWTGPADRRGDGDRVGPSGGKKGNT